MYTNMYTQASIQVRYTKLGISKNLNYTQSYRDVKMKLLTYI